MGLHNFIAAVSSLTFSFENVVTPVSLLVRGGLLLQELMTELSSEPRGWFDARPKIVILGGSPRLQMLQEVRAVIPRHLMRRNNVKLIFRQGMVSWR